MCSRYIDCMNTLYSKCNLLEFAGILVLSYEPILLARQIVRRLLGAKMWCPESCVCRQAQKMLVNKHNFQIHCNKLYAVYCRGKKCLVMNTLYSKCNLLEFWCCHMNQYSSLVIHFNKLCADYLEQKCGVRSPVFADKHKNAGK